MQMVTFAQTFGRFNAGETHGIENAELVAELVLRKIAAKVSEPFVPARVTEPVGGPYPPQLLARLRREGKIAPEPEPARVEPEPEPARVEPAVRPLPAPERPRAQAPRRAPQT